LKSESKKYIPISLNTLAGENMGTQFVRVINTARYAYLKLIAKKVRPFDEKAKEELRKSYTDFYNELYKMYKKGGLAVPPEPTEEIISKMEEELTAFVIEGLGEGEEQKVKIPIWIPSGYYTLKTVFIDEERTYATLSPLSKEDILRFLIDSGLTNETLGDFATEILERAGETGALDLVEIAEWILREYDRVGIETSPITIPSLPHIELLEVVIDVYKGRPKIIITESPNIDVGFGSYPRMAISRYDNYSLGVVRMPNKLIMWEKNQNEIILEGITVG